MKDLFKILLVAVGISVFITACDTDAEIKDPANLTDPDRSEQYYEQLRAYKQTDHPVAFGWFGNWVGAGASLENSLRGLPDSVDFVSIWGNWHSLNDVRKADLAYVQQKKGTRALICFIVANVGDQLTPEGIDPIEYWGEGEQGIRRYANAICDTIDKYGYDGFDYDYEPHYGSPGNISGRPEAEKVFIEELGKRIGMERPLYPHLMRHTFASHALSAGMDLTVIQHLLGHTDPKTTLIYAEINPIRVQYEYNRVIA